MADFLSAPGGDAYLTFLEISPGIFGTSWKIKFKVTNKEVDPNVTVSVMGREQNFASAITLRWTLVAEYVTLRLDAVDRQFEWNGPPFTNDGQPHIYEIEQDAGVMSAKIDGVPADNQMTSSFTTIKNFNTFFRRSGNYSPLDLYRMEMWNDITETNKLRDWNAASVQSNGTGSVLYDDASGNNASQQGTWPLDDSEWGSSGSTPVEYDFIGAMGLELDCSAASSKQIDLTGASAAIAALQPVMQKQVAFVAAMALECGLEALATKQVDMTASLAMQMAMDPVISKSVDLQGLMPLEIGMQATFSVDGQTVFSFVGGSSLQATMTAAIIKQANLQGSQPLQADSLATADKTANLTGQAPLAIDQSATLRKTTYLQGLMASLADIAASLNKTATMQGTMNLVISMAGMFFNPMVQYDNFTVRFDGVLIAQRINGQLAKPVRFDGVLAKPRFDGVLS